MRSEKVIIFLDEFVSSLLVIIEIVILLFLVYFHRPFIIVFGSYFVFKSIFVLLLFKFIFSHKSWLVEQGVIHSVFIDAVFPVILLVSQFVLFVFYMNYMLNTGIYLLINVIIVILGSNYSKINPTMFYFYLSTTNPIEYLREYRIDTKIDYMIILRASLLSLIAFSAIVSLIAVNSNFKWIQVNTIFEFIASLGIFFLPIQNYRDRLINQRYYKLMKKLSKGEEPVEFWRARWRLRG